MTEKGNDLEELKGLQAEAAKRRTERERQRSERAADESEQAAAAAPATPSATGVEADAEDVAAPHAAVAEGAAQEVVLPDFADQIGSIVKEIQEAASERPVLALVTAFSLGILVGRLFSRN